MSDEARAVHEIMCGLVARISHTAAASKIQAFTGAEKADGGTLSRKVHGNQAWTYIDILALETGGNGPVTDYLHDRRKPRQTVKGCLYEAVASASAESGEGIASVMRFLQTQSPADRAVAVREVRESRDFFNRLLEQIEATE